MPFRLLQTIKKAKAEKLKNKSKSTTDLYMGRSRLASEPTLTLHEKMEMVTKMKPRLSLFSHSKAVIPSQTDENGRDSNENVIEYLPQSRKASLATDDTPVTTAGHSRATQQRQSEPTLPHTLEDTAEVTMRNGRSASCHAIVEGARRERRMSDLNQLDQYIEYHQRRSVADSGSSTSRLVCAQLLRESLARLQQTARPERPPFKSEHSRSMSSLNHTQNTPTSSTTESFHSDSTTDSTSTTDTHSSAHHFQKNKITNPRRKLSQWNLAPLTQERRSSLGYIYNTPTHSDSISNNNNNFHNNNANHNNSNNNINASYNNYNNNNNNNGNRLSYVNSYNSDYNHPIYRGSSWNLAETSIADHESQVSDSRESNGSELPTGSSNGEHFDSLAVPTDMFTPRSFWKKHKIHTKRRKSVSALPIEIEIY